MILGGERKEANLRVKVTTYWLVVDNEFYFYGCEGDFITTQGLFLYCNLYGRDEKKRVKLL